MQPGVQSAKLVVTEEGKAESVVEIGERLTIGRSASNLLTLDDHKASRSHAEIRHVGGGRYRLSDVGSANGTWLNGRRLTIPKDLQDGDQIQIGGVQIRFVAQVAPRVSSVTASTGTALDLRNELVIVLVVDIRNYTTMSETLPNREFSQFIAEWFREGTEIIETNGGTIDKFIGDAVMAYWVAARKSDPEKEVNAVLKTAHEFIERAELFSNRLSGLFPGHDFRVGMGINMGDALLCNVGTGEYQSFTVVGDSVNVAFRLESLTKEKGTPVVVSKSVTEYASGEYRFSDLGKVEVKGRHELVSIWAMESDPETKILR
jgi:adenylate cyclase